MALQQLHAIVHGHVQGVSFRFYTLARANELSLTGWVANLPDQRSVEVVAEGTRPELEQLLAFLRQGPPAARVIEVEVKWNIASGRFDRFEVR